MALVINKDYLVTDTRKHGGKRKKPVRVLIPHHNAGVVSGKNLASYMKNTTRAASATYIIGNNGEIYQGLDESLEPYTTSNRAIDTEAITFEIANSKGAPTWEVSNAAFNTLVELSIDICKRYGIKELLFTGNKAGNVHLHKWYANTTCPGPYLESKMHEYARRVNLGLRQTSSESGVLYKVQVGAYKQKNNAMATEQKLKQAGFPTYVVQEGGLYKVQTGAFAKRANAEEQERQLKAKGFDTFIATYGKTKPQPKPVEKAIEVGSWVIVKNGATSYEGVKMSSRVYGKKYQVYQLRGNRAVLDKDGINTAFNIKDLILS